MCIHMNINMDLFRKINKSHNQAFSPLLGTYVCLRRNFYFITLSNCRRQVEGIVWKKMKVADIFNSTCHVYGQPFPL